MPGSRGPDFQLHCIHTDVGGHGQVRSPLKSFERLAEIRVGPRLILCFLLVALRCNMVEFAGAEIGDTSGSQIKMQFGVWYYLGYFLTTPVGGGANPVYVFEACRAYADYIELDDVSLFDFACFHAHG